MASSRQQSGDSGEIEVVNLIPCPNCKNKLMLLPKNYPLYDVQCSGCLFRAQVKTTRSKPKNVILGAGWNIMDKVIKSGHLIPPLIVNFKWMEKSEVRQEIRFYPFISKKNLTKYKLSETHRQANYLMFKYTGLDNIAYQTLYINK
jgi:hypothetical protein